MLEYENIPGIILRNRPKIMRVRSCKQNMAASSESAKAASCCSSSANLSETESEKDTSTCSSSSLSLLDRLKAPQKSQFSRKRAIKTNSGKIYKRHTIPSTKNDPKSVSAAERVSQYKDEPFTVSAGKLFCRACREEVGLKKSVIDKHVSSSNKHHVAKLKLKEKQQREVDIAQAFHKYASQEHAVGDTLPESQQVHRINVVSTFLRAGVPLSKIDVFRPVLEDGRYRLAGRRTMSDLIPFIHQEEVKKIKSEIEGRKVSVIFDGTTRLGEAMVIIVRFIDSEWAIQQRLVRMQLLAKSLTGEEIARELLFVLQAQYGIASGLLVAAMRDRASVNNLALSILRVMYPQALDVGCFSHTIDNAGRKLATPILDEFMSAWVSLFSHSPKGRLAWKARTSVAVRSYSQTRWWSKWEVEKQLMEMYGEVLPFLEENDVGLATRKKMLDILHDPQKQALLQIELAATVDGGLPLVQATYRLEGDGPLALTCFEEVDKVFKAIQVAHVPNLNRVAEKISHGQTSVKQQLVAYGISCIKPAFDYFVAKFRHELKNIVDAFKAAQLFLPQKVNDLCPDSSSVDSLKAIPIFQDTNVLDSLKAELPSYLSSAVDLGSDVDPLDWWKRHSTTLPNWSSAASTALLVQPSSAAAERVFSLLKSSFGDQQETTLQDYIETSLMLQFNGH